MATTPTTESLLADAKSAYHLLQTGRSARVVVDQNGERVEFTAANRMSLYNYIVELEGKLVSTTTAAERYGPAGFIF